MPYPEAPRSLRWWCLAAALLLSWPSSGAAYCRTTNCSVCPRNPETGCVEGGRPVAWPTECVSLSVQIDASEFIDKDLTQELVRKAFKVWENADCDGKGSHPSIRLKDPYSPTICARSEYFPAQPNANTVVYRDDLWPYENDLYTELASTSVRFDNEGNIVDADMEINTTLPLVIPDAGSGGGFVPGAHDLLSLFVHEVGHYLGLDHSRDPRAIMQPSLPPRVVRIELSQDDIDAICDAYPPKRKSVPCAPEPANGFSAECGLDPATGGACSAQPGPSRAPWLASTLVVGAASLLVRRRRA